MKEVLSMPSLCDATDFGLSNEVFNRSQAVLWLKRNPNLLESIGDSSLYRIGDSANGFIFLYDPRSKFITYYIRYKTKKTKLHGLSVTQTSLWRSLGAPDTEDITRHVVFDILLKEYPAILSDQLQTDDGRRFWIDLMGKALTRGYQVALVDFTKQLIHPIDSYPALRIWTHETEGAWSWNSMKHRGLRFVIYRKGDL